ncbi:MAG: MFS transporter [Thermodesulfobacteriota bacterium]|nr:MFS transporter [Thermodesulfobacteriota bacterium]
MNRDKTKSVLRFRWLIFFILSLAYFFVYFHRLSLSVVANDLVKDFQTTASAIGVLGSIYFYCYAVMQLPAGLLSDSIGPRKTVTFFLLIASAGSILFGFAPNIETAYAGRVMVGLGVSMVFIPAMKILSQWFRAHEFALMAGILNAVGGAGVLAATWLLALMVAWFGWRVSFELIGVCTIAAVVLGWLIIRDRPEDKGLPSLAQIDGKGSEVMAPVNQIGLWEGARQVVAEKYFWPVAVWYFFDCGIFFGFGALWSGPYLMHVYGMTRAEAGTVLSMIAWGMIVGSPILGFLSDRVLKSRKKVFVFCTSGLVLILLFFNIFPSDLPHAVLYVLFFMFSICASCIVAIGFTMTKELFPVAIAGTSVGTVNLFPFLGGAVFMPALGKVLDAYPKSATGYSLDAYATLLLILLGTSLAALICTFMMKETFPSEASNE